MCVKCVEEWEPHPCKQCGTLEGTISLCIDEDELEPVGWLCDACFEALGYRCELV